MKKSNKNFVEEAIGYVFCKFSLLVCGVFHGEIEAIQVNWFKLNRGFPIQLNLFKWIDLFYYDMYNENLIDLSWMDIGLYWLLS